MSMSAIQKALGPHLSSDTFTIKGDSTLRGAAGTPSGTFINRFGQVSGSGTTIILEGGGVDWADALSNNNAAPYYTRAQLMAVGAIKQYLRTMSNAFVDEKL